LANLTFKAAKEAMLMFLNFQGAMKASR